MCGTADLITSIGANRMRAKRIGLGALFAITLLSQAAAQHSVIPENGFVPNAQVAIAIADAVLRPIYGAQAINRQSPLTARLVDGRWVVEGQLPVRNHGGVAIVEIDPAKGTILRVSHGR